MKSWPAVIALLCFVGLAFVVRRSLRGGVSDSLVKGAGTTRSSGRRRALIVFGTAAGLGLVVLAAGFYARTLEGPWSAARYLAAALVIGLCVPIITLGAPKMTRWQKTFAQRLQVAGAHSEAAAGAGAVARPFSALGVLMGLAAALLVF